MEKSQLLRNLRMEMQEKKISIKLLAESVGFSEVNVRNIFNSSQRLHLDFFLKACEVLGKHPCEFFEEEYSITEKLPETVAETKPIYAKFDMDNFVKREDFVFLKTQFEKLNEQNFLLIKLIQNNNEKSTNYDHPAYLSGRLQSTGEGGQFGSGSCD